MCVWSFAPPGTSSWVVLLLDSLQLWLFFLLFYSLHAFLVVGIVFDHSSVWLDFCIFSVSHRASNRVRE